MQEYPHLGTDSWKSGPRDCKGPAWNRPLFLPHQLGPQTRNDQLCPLAEGKLLGNFFAL